MRVLAPAETLASAPAAPPSYRVEVREGRAAFEALRAEWNALVAAGPADLPFVRHEWLSAWLDAFAPDGRLRVIAARDAAGRAAGFAPLLEERARGLVRLRAPANDHSCRFEWALGPDAAGAAAAIWAHLRDRLRWDVLHLRDLPRDGPTSTLLEALARADRHLTGRWESLRSPYLPLGGGPAEARTSSKFRANLRRRERRLLELGPVAVERGSPPGGLDGALDAFFALEAAGWKGARGTAIARDPRLVGFYRRVAADAAARGALALRALTVGGRPVACFLALVHRGALCLPKVAYDEGLGAVSPGQLLLREVLAEAEARGLAELDFLGPDMEWKRDWAPRHRPHDWLTIYRPTLAGRALHAARHRLRPALKEVLGWLR